MRKLIESFFTGRNHRWATYVVSGVVSILYASIYILTGHKDRTEVGLITATLFCLFLVFGILFYSILRKVPPEYPHPQTLPQTPPRQFPAISTTWHQMPSRRIHFTPTLMLIAIAIAIASVAIGWYSNWVPKLQALVIAARLELANRTITHASTIQSPEQADSELRERFQKIQSIADVSYRYQIPIGLNSLSGAEATVRTSLKRPALSDQTKQTGLVASAKLVDLAALRKTEANTERPSGYVFNSTFQLSDQSIRFKGDHTLFALNDYFVIRRSTVVFDGIDFQLSVEQPFDPDSGSTVIIRSSVIENFYGSLDGITWIDVQFRHPTIRFNGGPFTLVNVSFKDYDLRWLQLPFGGQVAEQLREMIIKANGQPITFAFEGYPKTTQQPE